MLVSKLGWLLTVRNPDYERVEEEVINGDSPFEMESQNSQSTHKLLKEVLDDVQKFKISSMKN